MNTIAKVSFLVGLSQQAAQPVTCTTDFYKCMTLYSDSTCATKVAATASQALTDATNWMAAYFVANPNVCTAGTGSSKIPICDTTAGTIKVTTYTGPTDCDSAASGATTADSLAQTKNVCALYSTVNSVNYYMKLQTDITQCSGQVSTGNACASDFFKCGGQYTANTCATTAQVLETPAQQQAAAPTVLVDCTPDAANAAAQDASTHRWYKGNCLPSSGSGTTAVVGKYEKVVYADSACTRTIAPFVVAADTKNVNTCEQQASSTTIWTKWITDTTTCNYATELSYTHCPVRQNFFTCSNKFGATACPTDNKVEQTSAQSNFTAQTENELMQLTCTAAAANAVAATAASAYRWTNGVCDATAGYSVKTFLDSECKYADTAVADTGVIAPSTCYQLTGSTTEWVKYEIDAANCEFTAAQEYGAKPFMMAASAALVAAASMF